MNRIRIIALIVLFAASVHYTAAQDETPVTDEEINVVHFEPLHYPTLARSANIQGVVVVRAMLDQQGNVVRAVALSGKRPLIDNTIANVLKWRFRANRRKTVVLVYEFTLPVARCGKEDDFFMLRGANLVMVTGCPAPVEP